MKPKTLIIALALLALPGCTILLPVAKFLAIPIAKRLLAGGEDDCEKKDEDSKENQDDEENQEEADGGQH